MKRITILFILIITFAISLDVSANNASPSEFSFSFNENDYIITTLNNTDISITLKDENSADSGAAQLLPVHVKSLMLPYGMDISGFDIKKSERRLGNTNGFDIKGVESSLAEGFIQGKDNGVVAYLGNAREGWSYFINFV